MEKDEEKGRRKKNERALRANYWRPETDIMEGRNRHRIVLLGGVVKRRRMADRRSDVAAAVVVAAAAQRDCSRCWAPPSSVLPVAQRLCPHN